MAQTFYPDLLVANRSYLDHDTPPGEEAPRAIAGGLLAALQNALEPSTETHDGTVWIGAALGKYDREFVDEQGRELIARNGDYVRGRRVFVEPERWDAYYRRVANRGLWPLLHCNEVRLDQLKEYFPTPELSAVDDFEQFKAANRQFGEAAFDEFVRRERGPKSAWIHDYHLPFVSAHLRSRLREVGRDEEATIGYFLHTPFVNLRLFEDDLLTNPDTRGFLASLLEALLVNDLVGFQSRGDADRCAEALAMVMPDVRVRQLESGSFEAQRGGNARITYGRAMPISIDVEAARISITADEPIEHVLPDGRPLREVMEEYRQQGIRVLVGLDRTDYTKGIPERIQIVGHLLEMGERVVYLGFGAPTRPGVPAFDALVDLVRTEAERVNQRFAGTLSWEPVQFHYAFLPLSDIFRIMRDADVVLTTSLSDGLNIVPLQTIAAQSLLPAERRHLAVAGKNTGIGRALERFAEGGHGFATVDPLDPPGAARRLAQSLRADERISDALVDYVREHDVHHWSASFLAALNELARRA
jgi:trehalose-6-phosphate synthase